MRPASRRGFKLIELILAMALMAVLLAIALPYYRKYQARSALRLGASTLAADLRYARGLAIKSGPATVDMRTSGRYDITDTNARKVRTQTLPDKVTIASGSTLVFAENGTADRDVTISVNSSALNEALSISVSKRTGQVSGP
ncbi:MAG: prepilin-type N-terminal cleavage/methylation domain-containing protein [Armatimonadetes bacterium]|nr:prepilin-type N-terminal cleavage/methylation domain-containing protein [Armatimonadota bacterium]